jgi:murein DD-endopeptidase MepM/ murein hydrolase activator NlpD
MRNLTTTRIVHLPDPAASVASVRPWTWPLPRLDGMPPCILSSDEPSRADAMVHLGYRDRSSSSDFVPVFAPQDGVITYAVRADQGATLCLDHPGGWSTQCSELETVLALSTDRFSRRRKVRVRAGDVIGHVRTSLRLGFGLSRLVDSVWTPVDPAALVHSWTALPWFARDAARNRAELAG